MIELLPPGQPGFDRLSSGRRVLTRDLNLRHTGTGRTITVPKGFDTDYSSWPRWLPGPHFSKVDIAGIVHDALYRWGRWGEEPDADPCTRAEADRVWRVLAQSGERRVIAPVGWLGWAGLRVFGWLTWRGYRRPGAF